MKPSFSYKITIAILKLMGIKKTFSQDPINFKKVRKQDVHVPKGAYFKKNAKSFQIAISTVTEINSDSPAKKLVLFIHGGAFISGPVQHHWASARSIVESNQSTVWMCDYPKAPENNIVEISKNLDEIYEVALERFSDYEITLIGDSVGGTLITALTQRLVQQKDKLPKRIVLISPVMDASMSNPEIKKIDQLDPMLSKNGVLSAKKMCAQDMDLSNPMISPLNVIL
jgi:acetyl esterase/lipase